MLNTLVCVAQSNKRTQTSQEKFGATDLTNDNLSAIYNYHFLSKMLLYSSCLWRPRANPLHISHSMHVFCNNQLMMLLFISQNSKQVVTMCRWPWEGGKFLKHLVNVKAWSGLLRIWKKIGTAIHSQRKYNLSGVHVSYFLPPAPNEA
jgi:hypothetical protein